MNDGIQKAHVTKHENQTNRRVLHDEVHEVTTQSPVMKPIESQLAESGAWVISDQSCLRQQLLHTQGFRPVNGIHFDLHSKLQFNHLANRLQAEKPKILWVRLAGPACGSGNRKDDRRASFLVRLVLEQLNSSGKVLIEGNIRSEGWNLRPIQELRTQDKLRETLHKWCRYQSPQDNACSATTRILSNAEITDCGECKCWTDRQHFAVKCFTDVKSIETLVLLDVIRKIKQCLGDASDRQPELPNYQLPNHPSAESHYPRINALISQPETLTSSTVSNAKTTTTTDSTFSRAIVPDSLSATASFKTMTLDSSQPKKSQSVSFDSPVADRSNAADPLESQSFPTEQANRQKERRKAGVPVQKRKQIVEQHQDDVGDDLSSIQVEPSEISAHFQDRMREENLTDWEHAIFSFVFSAQLQQSSHDVYTSSTFDELDSHADAFGQSNARRIHVCEMFGGEGHTSKLCARFFGLNSGVNFEIQIGFDLNSQNERQKLFQYLEKHKPDVVVMAPPCKGFGPWTYLNEVINPDAVKSARSEGVPLAKLCAHVAQIQLTHGRHFILEQPRNSTMFDLKEWKQLMPQLHIIVCDQCRFGLVEKNGMPLKKPTKFVASHATLLAHLQNKFCLERHSHGKVTSDAEKWPLKLCKAIATGIADLLCDRHCHTQHLLFLPTFSCPGCRGHVRRDDPRHVRDETCKFKDDETTEWTCPACKKHRHRSDTTHTLGPDCRWAIANYRVEGAGRARRGHHPRDPSVPASSDPTSRLRLPDQENSEHPDQVVADSVEPEVLTPAQAAARRKAKQSIEVQAGFDPDLVETSDIMPAAPASSSDGPAAPIVPVSEELVPLPDAPAWSKFELGTTLQLLRSVRPGVVRRTLRRLHIRWYHAPAKRMATLLSAAGVPTSVLRIIQDVVSTCDICRSWSRPSARSIVSTRMPEKFNQEIEIDLLFVGAHVILHMIDRAIRWSVGVKIANRETRTILSGVKKSWVNQFGPPGVMISDQEGGLNEMAGAFLEQLGVKLDLRARGQHAGIVERHNDILRKQIHLIDGQAVADGLAVSFEDVLTEAVYSKNVLCQYGGFTPYEALYGRTPPLFNVWDDNQDDNHPMKLREIALRSMLQATAEGKMVRADSSKTRPAGELAGLEVGDAVDIYRPTLSKDVSRWNGPATVTDLTSLRDGIVGVKWQGRNLQVKVQECRRALAYMFAPILFGGSLSPIDCLRRAAESFNGVMRLGWIRKGGDWITCEGNKDFQDVLHAGLHVAAVNLQLLGVFSFRFGSHVKTLSGLYCDESSLCWWKSSEFQSWSYAFHAGSQSLNLHNLCGTNVAFVQFLMEDGAAIAQLRKLNIDIANIGGVFEPRMPIVRELPLDSALNNPLKHRPRNPKMITDKQPSFSPSNVDDQVDISVSNTHKADDSDPASDHDEAISNLPDEGVDQDPEQFIGWTCAATPPPWPCISPLPSEIFIIEDDAEPAELEFSCKLFPYLVMPEVPQPSSDSCLVMQYSSSQHADSALYGAVIERTHNILSREEAIANVEACRTSMIKELNRWHKHNAWERAPLTDSSNLLRSKWVLKWKQINGQKDVKGRLVAQGFQDRQSLSTFSGTTSRWGQRIVLAVGTQFSWQVVSADVSEAFLRGITFKQLAEMDKSQPLRKVEISLPPGAEQLIRTLPGMESFDPSKECLRLLKPGFGLKDAPRLWNLALRQVLQKGGLNFTQTDRQLFVKHENGQLVLLLSVHVDDLKITGKPDQIKMILELITESFDELKIEKDNFDHLGLKHTLLSDGSRTIDQSHYVSELKFIDEVGCKHDQPVSEDLKSQYLSLLGGISWVTQSRPDVAVFVAALQRKLQAPCGKDIINLNRVLAYLKRNPLKFTYRKVNKPWRLYVISDSSFKGEENDALAMRSGIIALGDKDGPVVGDNSLQIIEFVSKKQSRICRSTFTAELYASLDLVSLANVINLAMTEVLTGCRSATAMAEIQENGLHSLESDIIIDARSVFECVKAADVKATTDKPMLIHALKLKEVLALRIVHRLLWIDTRDMLADGLNKGIVSRDAIRMACSTGIWKIASDFQVHTEART